MSESSVWEVIDTAPEDMKVLLEFYAPELMVKRTFLRGWLKDIERVAQDEILGAMGEADEQGD